jgi:hypothetical protein
MNRSWFVGTLAMFMGLSPGWISYKTRVRGAGVMRDPGF